MYGSYDGTKQYHQGGSQMICNNCGKEIEYDFMIETECADCYGLTNKQEDLILSRKNE